MFGLMTAFLGCTACSTDDGNEIPVPENNNKTVSEAEQTEYRPAEPTENQVFQIQMTTPVPSDYFKAATQQGVVELLTYKSRDYTGSMAETDKPAYVYLPYGYNPEQQYDIIYLLHGWTGVAQEYFLGRGGNSRTGLVNIFDNLIQNGDCKPFIAVSPTWDKDNQSKGWSESTQEAAVFAQEYVNDLIPAVESHYSTYCEDFTKEGIKASRKHRAIGGFSLGSITFSYHQKEGGKHDFNAVWEFCYHALQFFFEPDVK